MYKRSHCSRWVVTDNLNRSHVSYMYPVEGLRVCGIHETLMDKIKRALRIGHPYARRCRA